MRVAELYLGDQAYHVASVDPEMYVSTSVSLSLHDFYPPGPSAVQPCFKAGQSV